MSLRDFLRKERPPHRTLAVGLGAVAMAFACLFAFQHRFTNLAGPATLGGIGIALVVAGITVAEGKLQWVFTVAILANVVAAVVALLAPT